MNNDGYLCAKGLPDSENFIDNVANTPIDGSRHSFSARYRLADAATLD